MNEKLIKIQSELKAPKNQRNNFGNYNYRSCEDILEAVKPLLKAQGLTITISDTVENIGNHNYVKATATISDGTDKIEVSAYAREAETKKGMDDSQITGSTSSYARKYALNGLFAIDDTKDADSQDNRSQAPKTPQKAKPDPLAKAKRQIGDYFQTQGLNTVQQKAAIHQVLKKSTVDTVEEANEVLQALEDGAI
jgi:C1A family cysteine protease